MTKVLIVEDEQAVARRLMKLLNELVPEFEILEVLDSVEDVVTWLKNNTHPDLFFMDIQLADGISFEIFEQVEVRSPIIFTTAFDNYAIRAFKVNSVDYLLKPINKEELKWAVEKFKQSFLANSEALNQINYKSLAKEINSGQKPLQSRMLVRYGQKLKSIQIKEIACFYTENKTVYLHTFTDDRYPIDERLDALENVLDRQQFFRVNRGAIVNFEAIHEMYAYSKSRVNVELKSPLKLSFVSSTERSSQFKDWLSGKDSGI